MVRKTIFRLLIFNAPSLCCYLSSWLLQFQLTKLFSIVFRKSLAKIEAHLLLAYFFVLIFFILHPSFNLKNKAQLRFFLAFETFKSCLHCINSAVKMSLALQIVFSMVSHWCCSTRASLWCFKDVKELLRSITAFR